MTKQFKEFIDRLTRAIGKVQADKNHLIHLVVSVDLEKFPLVEIDVHTSPEFLKLPTHVQIAQHLSLAQHLVETVGKLNPRIANDSPGDRKN